MKCYETIVKNDKAIHSWKCKQCKYWNDNPEITFIGDHSLLNSFNCEICYKSNKVHYDYDDYSYKKEQMLIIYDEWLKTGNILILNKRYTPKYGCIPSGEYI